MEKTTTRQDRNVVVIRRDDGSISSVNQVDEQGIVHGIRTTYYQDGKSMYAKLAFEHGIKQGPSEKYYENGQVYEHTNYEAGEKHGISRKFYKNGVLMAEIEYFHGLVLPGLKEYTMHGLQVTSYPGIVFSEDNQFRTANRIDLFMSCTDKDVNVRYYLIGPTRRIEDRIYLISENGQASLRYYVEPGGTIDKGIDIVAEIPTKLGNVLVRRLSYHLSAENRVTAE